MASHGIMTLYNGDMCCTVLLPWVPHPLGMPRFMISSQKADKSALEAKVNLQDLKMATNQLSDMMQDLLQKMSLQDKDWQKALEKLFVDMDCKVATSASVLLPGHTHPGHPGHHG